MRVTDDFAIGVPRREVSNSSFFVPKTAKHENPALAKSTRTATFVGASGPFAK
jgi:hypothetical protein